MSNKLILAPVLGLLFVLLYWNPSGLDNVFGSTSEDEDDTDDDNSATAQPVQQPLANNSTSGIATSIYDTHEFNVRDGVQNLFILIPN